MKIVLVRHGRAEPKKEGFSDADRRLTEEGRRGVEAVARHINMEPSMILSSPYRRALETAEILASTLGGRVVVVEELEPEAPSGVDALARINVGDRYILVGHNPWMEHTLSELVGGRIEMKAGSAAIVEIESLKPGGGILLALVSPEVALTCQARQR